METGRLRLGRGVVVGMELSTGPGCLFPGDFCFHPFRLCSEAWKGEVTYVLQGV